MLQRLRFDRPETIPELLPGRRLADASRSLHSCCRCQAAKGQCEHSAAEG